MAQRLVVAVALLLAHAASCAAVQRNIIHIIVDDLRSELGAYGLPHRHTPNLDKLAASGTVFDRAYAQQAVCGPSRNSFLSGRRPDRSRSWNFIDHFREDHPEWTSLPGVFKTAGWLALGSGKAFHPKLPPAYDGNRSWSAEALPYFNPCLNTADDPNASFQDGGLPCFFCPIDIVGHIDHKVNVSVANEFCAIDAYEDTLTVDRAVKLMRGAKSANRFFYLAVGLHKPHMPWQYTQEDLDKHPLENVTAPAHPLPPTNVPPIAMQFTDEHVHASPWQPVSSTVSRAARRAYRAAVTGMDRKLGVLLDELDALGLAGTTAVIAHGDHGWQLGELGEFRKFTNFELATKVPLIIRAPWLEMTPRYSGLVELVDMLPTMAELAGAPLPDGEVFDGASLVPFIARALGSPAKAAPLFGTAVKPAAFSQYPRRVTDPAAPWKDNSIIHHNRTSFTHMGLSVRVEGYRYTEWLLWDPAKLAPMWSNVTANELYDHRDEATYPIDYDDPSESTNVAADKANADVVAQLADVLREAFGNGTDETKKRDISTDNR